MNEVLEQKIKDLMEEADRHGAWAVRAVLHMLLGSHRMAQQRQFARHCCQFSNVQFQMQTGISDRLDDPMGDEPPNDYLH